ncbi:MAG: peptidoglycan recognition protein, partial [Bifidobacteriaceae bacterium]|nr:peptidoglycan recognition protein [Bifidobacteriaceae bacterium]
SPSPSSGPTTAAPTTPSAPTSAPATLAPPQPEPPAPEPAPSAPPAVPPPAADPVIHSRDEWGANEARVKEKPKYFATLRGAIVHHTAGSNIYTQDQVAGVVRGIFNYHVGSLKWNDIGYNFLVDKYGGIWEGRAGGVTSNVVGAHANHFNSETFGVSVLGNYEKVEPTPESIAALTSIVGWRLAVGGIYDPDATTTYATNGKELPVIIGHKDAAYRRGGVSYNATSCPGQYLYPYLDTLRAGAVYPVVDRPGIAGPSDVTPGEIGTYTLTWGSTSGPVSGLVEVQRFNGSTWAPMARVDVAAGVGQWQVRPSGVYTYRAVALAVAEPAGWRLPPKATSASLVTTRVISRGATRTPRLLVPSYAPAGKVATAVALWANPYDNKPAKLELQVRKGNKWVKVKNVTVDGVRLFKIKVSATAKYRLKAHKASAPTKGKLRASKTAKIRVWS